MFKKPHIIKDWAGNILDLQNYFNPYGVPRLFKNWDDAESFLSDLLK